MNSLSHGWMYLLKPHKQKEHKYLAENISDHNSVDKQFTTHDAHDTSRIKLNKGTYDYRLAALLTSPSCESKFRSEFIQKCCNNFKPN